MTAIYSKQKEWLYTIKLLTKDSFLQNSFAEMTVKPRDHNSGLRMSTLHNGGAGPGAAGVHMAHIQRESDGRGVAR